MDKLKYFNSSIFESRDGIKLALLKYLEDINRTDMFRISRSHASLSDDDKEWVDKVRQKLGVPALEDSVRVGVKINQSVLTEMVKLVDFVVLAGPNRDVVNPSRIRAIPLMFARHWSNDSIERDQVYPALISALSECTGEVLVPGSGAGRLLYEIAKSGHEVVGVEHDPLALLVFASVLAGKSVEVVPNVLETCNRVHACDNEGRLICPEIEIDHSILGKISLYGNDFWKLKFVNSRFSSVVTCFFIDSVSATLVELVGEISRLLKTGGIWVNCGPLGFHYNGEPMTGRKETFSLEQLRIALTDGGFEIVNESIINTTYIGNHKSMMKTIHICPFFVAKKL